MRKLFRIEGCTDTNDGWLLLDGAWVVNGHYYVDFSNKGKTAKLSTKFNYPKGGMPSHFVRDVPNSIKGDYNAVIDAMIEIMEKEKKPKKRKTTRADKSR